jgi:hypothetical protein
MKRYNKLRDTRNLSWIKLLAAKSAFRTYPIMSNVSFLANKYRDVWLHSVSAGCISKLSFHALLSSFQKFRRLNFLAKCYTQTFGKLLEDPLATISNAPVCGGCMKKRA